MDNRAEKRQKLIQRLNRSIGQIEAIKKRLEQGDENCDEIMHILKAGTASLKKFGEAYIRDHLDQCMRDRGDQQQFEYQLQNAVKAAFEL